LRFVVDVHTTCFGLHGHLQVCKIFCFLVLKESASLLLLQGKVKKPKHAHMKMEINENATKTSTN
jgi:hypothetical protein